MANVSRGLGLVQLLDVLQTVAGSHLGRDGAVLVIGNDLLDVVGAY